MNSFDFGSKYRKIERYEIASLDDFDSIFFFLLVHIRMEFHR